MSEALIAALAQFVDARIAAAGATAPAPTPTPSPTPTPTPTPAPAADPFGGLGGGTPAPAAEPEVTAKMVQELIMPLLPNEVAKQKLTQAMAEVGVAELPAATQEQLPALYAKFKAISDEVSGAGATASPTPTPTPAPSII